MVKKVLVSACLLGECCRYDGKGSVSEEVEHFLVGKEAIPICPEVMGGLSTPRTPCEIIKNRVMDKNGEDKSEAYQKGAQCVLALAKENQCKLAILKSRSPSCGSNQIYDGTFSGKLILGDGICAQLLKANQIVVLSEEELKNFDFNSIDE